MSGTCAPERVIAGASKLQDQIPQSAAGSGNFEQYERGVPYTRRSKRSGNAEEPGPASMRLTGAARTMEAHIALAGIAHLTHRSPPLDGRPRPGARSKRATRRGAATRQDAKSWGSRDRCRPAVNPGVPRGTPRPWLCRGREHHRGVPFQRRTGRSDPRPRRRAGLPRGRHHRCAGCRRRPGSQGSNHDDSGRLRDRA